MIWLRLHTKTRHDRQLQQMPAELFRHLVNIWTLAKDFDEGGELPCLADTAFELRLQEDEAASVLVKLAGMGLLVKNKGSYSVKNWDFWQYRDDSKNRMRELRRRKRDGRGDGRGDAECDGKSDGSCYEIGDTSDAHRAEQSRAETDKTSASASAERVSEKARLRTKQQQWFDQWWATVWRKVDRKHALDKFCRLVLDEQTFNRIVEATALQSPVYLRREIDKQPHPATWLNKRRWEDDPAAYQPAQPTLIQYRESEVW